MKTTTACGQCTVIGSALFVGIELSDKKWKLAFAQTPGQRPRLRDIEAWDLEQMKQEVKQTLEHFKLGADTAIYTCYEAGRDGFGVHRALEARGWHNLVIQHRSQPPEAAGQERRVGRPQAKQSAGAIHPGREGRLQGGAGA